MLNSTTLEVAIGLALVFLLLSLFCTTINESIAAVLGWRARTLERGLHSLFSGGQIKVVDDKNVETLRSLTDVVYNHGLIQSLYKGSPTQTFTPASAISSRDLPSYIPSRVFASTLYDILFNGPVQPLRDPSPAGRLKSMVDALNGLPDSKAKEALLPLVKQAQGDADATRQALEQWFNDGMDRVSGWYKRRTQLVLFVLGLFIAVLMNIDTISVARTLWASPAARAYAIKTAEGYATPPAPLPAPRKPAARRSARGTPAPDTTSPDTTAPATNAPAAAAPDTTAPDTTAPDATPPDTATPATTVPASTTPDATLTTTTTATPTVTPASTAPAMTASQEISALGELALPLGWNKGTYPWSENTDGHQKSGGEIAFNWVSAILGWILTAFAVTLGAPFWFDLLNQFMVIRSTVKPTEKSGDEGSKDPSPA